MATAAPAMASFSAIAAPKPRDAPVTRAILPARLTLIATPLSKATSIYSIRIHSHPGHGLNFEMLYRESVCPALYWRGALRLTVIDESLPAGLRRAAPGSPGESVMYAIEPTYSS